jgi:glycerophosphoryl diester phosphodiesterase
VDILACAEDRFVVAHDATLGPSTTGRGRLADNRLADLASLYHRDSNGAADPDAPVSSLAEFVAPLRSLTPAPGATLQLDLKLPAGRSLSEALIADAASSLAGLQKHIIIGSYHLEQARVIAAVLPQARVGYDPMLAVQRNPVLARDSARLLRHIERRSQGTAIAYLRYDLVTAAAENGFPLVKHLIELGIETDVWTLNPGPQLTDAVLQILVESGVRQITTDSPREIAARIIALRCT